MTEQDRDRIEETIASEGYALLAERMREMLKGEQTALESRSASEADLRYRQGSVAVLRAVLTLPQTMMAECEPTRGKRG